MNPERAAVSFGEHLKIPACLCSFHHSESVFLAGHPEVGCIVACELEEHAGIGASLVCLAGGVQKTRAETQTGCHTFSVANGEAARADTDVRRRLGEVMTELLAVRFNGYRALTMLARGQIPGPEAGLAKVTMVNAAIQATDLGADVVGPDALERDSEWAYLISFLPGLKSAGGTEQILRNTIGERVLGLPPEPRLDKGVPFSELRAKEKEALAG